MFCWSNLGLGGFLLKLMFGILVLSALGGCTKCSRDASLNEELNEANQGEVMLAPEGEVVDEKEDELLADEPKESETSLAIDPGKADIPAKELQDNSEYDS